MSSLNLIAFNVSTMCWSVMGSPIAESLYPIRDELESLCKRDCVKKDKLKDVDYRLKQLIEKSKTEKIADRTIESFVGFRESLSALIGTSK